MAGLLNSRVRAQSLVDVVTERLEAAIMNGELSPGSRLSEQSLAASLGVSRGPLREAIRRLEGRKLVERTPNIGVRIAELSLRELHQLVVVREVLEGLASRLAAENMSDAEIAELRRLYSELFEDGTGGRRAEHEHPEDFDFHVAIVMGSKNARLIEMLPGDLYHLNRVYRHKLARRSGRIAQAVDEHKAIVDAIAARDPDAAEAAMRRHMRGALTHIEAQIAEEAAAPGSKAAAL